MTPDLFAGFGLTTIFFWIFLRVEDQRMVRRRGISLLATALVFLLFAAYTISRLPRTPDEGIENVRSESEGQVGRGREVKGAQRVMLGADDAVGAVEEGDVDGSLDENMDESHPAEVPVVEEGSIVEEDSPEEEVPGVEEVPAAEIPSMEDTPAEKATTSPSSWTPTSAPTSNQNELASESANDPTIESPGSPTDTTKSDPTTEVLDLPAETYAVHPIAHLVQKAAEESQALLSRQSTTLEQAVAEYRRRYNMPPPPHFDKWFSFAQSRNVTLVDEFDTVHDMLTPFWGLPPRTIRARATEALGYGNGLMGILVRGGEVVFAAGGKDWERDAVRGMLSGFIEWLPDMDLAFNAHDEPRIVLQHDDLSRLVERGREAQARAAGAINNFTQHAEDLNDGRSIPEVPTSRFMTINRQSAWSVSRMSCPPTSPARSLDDSPDSTAHCLSPLCFVSNTTALTDICESPSLQHTHGFLDRPNSLSVSHDLVPVFSPSKLSSFQDIVVPAPWYWAGRVAYDPADDLAWEDKTDGLYWRGSTTGGFSRWGGWRRHHRQRAVQRLNGDSPSGILVNTAPNATDASTPPQWFLETAPTSPIHHLLNVSFSHVGQCDPGDCAAQRHAFPLSPRAPQRHAFGHKFLLDIDGNAFSGRFQAFLQSASLVFKVALFREWSGGGWVVPWRDYVPLSLGGEEWVEAVRYLGTEGEGRVVAEEMAAEKGMGRGDMEVWLFRLLLE